MKYIYFMETYKFNENEIELIKDCLHQNFEMRTSIICIKEMDYFV